MVAPLAAERKRRAFVWTRAGRPACWTRAGRPANDRMDSFPGEADAEPVGPTCRSGGQGGWPDAARRNAGALATSPPRVRQTLPSRSADDAKATLIRFADPKLASRASASAPGWSPGARAATARIGLGTRARQPPVRRVRQEGQAAYGGEANGEGSLVRVGLLGRTSRPRRLRVGRAPRAGSARRHRHGGQGRSLRESPSIPCSRFGSALPPSPEGRAERPGLRGLA